MPYQLVSDITHIYIRSVYHGSCFTCYVMLILVWLYVAGQIKKILRFLRP